MNKAIATIVAASLLCGAPALASVKNVKPAVSSTKHTLVKTSAKVSKKTGMKSVGSKLSTTSKTGKSSKSKGGKK